MALIQSPTFGVAPRAGAWIETLNTLRRITAKTVAPRAGAWIETGIILVDGATVWSHPVRVRGLKPSLRSCMASRSASHPVRVRGLKLGMLLRTQRNWQSHPVRVRGLKQAKVQQGQAVFKSHPVRVRGLKHAFDPLIKIGIRRTPCGCVD